MSEFRAIRAAYDGIFTKGDFVGPFAEFYSLVKAAKPEPEAMASPDLSRQDAGALRAIQGVRSVRTYMRGESCGPYFRGSGIVVVGDRDGIVAVDYQAPKGDPVADRYGNYPHVALVKAGIGALSLRLGGEPVAKQYDKVEEVLVSTGIKTATDPPHHLGYAYRSPTPFSAQSQPLIAGASGMLPGYFLAFNPRLLTPSQLAHDQEQGWVKPRDPDHPLVADIDELAGYHDLVAADSALGTLVAGQTTMATFDARKLRDAGLNLH